MAIGPTFFDRGLLPAVPSWTPNYRSQRMGRRGTLLGPYNPTRPPDSPNPIAPDPDPGMPIGPYTPTPRVGPIYTPAPPNARLPVDGVVPSNSGVVDTRPGSTPPGAAGSPIYNPNFTRVKNITPTPNPTDPGMPIGPYFPGPEPVNPPRNSPQPVEPAPRTPTLDEIRLGLTRSNLGYGGRLRV